MLRVFGRRRREDGAVAVEAALVVPLLATLVFGMIEFGFLLKDYAGVSALTRAGARIASTGADAGNATCETGTGAPPCAPASTPTLAQMAADAIQRSGAISNPDQVQYILIYEANSKGFPGAETNTTMPTDCTGVASCVRFTWRPTADAFRYANGAWDSRTISACFPGSTTNPLLAMDRVGIYVRANHKMMTGLFGASISINDRAVMDFEPLPTQTCGANQHP